LDEAFAGFQVLKLCVIKMSKQNFFGQRERSRQSSPHDLDIPR
jgi:hypothetical protein